MKLGLSGVLTRTFHQFAADAAVAAGRAGRGRDRARRLCRARKSRRSACRWSTSSSPPTATRPRKQSSWSPAARRHRQGHQRGRARLFADEETASSSPRAFSSAPTQDTAVLRVHEKIRANIERPAQGHSRAADRRPRHQRCRDRRADARRRSPDAAERWTDNGSIRSPRSCSTS